MNETICDDCKQPIVGLCVWLGERDNEGKAFELPFHPTCADQPWPLYEVRRSMEGTPGAGR